MNLKDGNFERLQNFTNGVRKKNFEKKTDRGTDVGLNLDSGVKLRHGDVLKNEDKKIVDRTIT